MKLVVTIPAYNEENTITSVIQEIPRNIEGVESVEVLVVDDGSTDHTVSKARQAGADHIVSHYHNEGLGVTFRDGLEAALQLGADIIVNIDGDGQYNGAEIPKLIEPILEDEADIVLGWRDIDSLGFMPNGKKIGNKMATWLTNAVCGSNASIRDAQSGFRAFSKESALRMHLSGRYTYVQETLMEAKYKGLKVAQLPIDFRPRPGESRLIRNLPSYALRAGRIILSTYWKYNPLKIFGIIGGILLLVGVGLGLRVLIHYLQAGTISPNMTSMIVASLSCATGLQAIVLGLFAEIMKSQRLLQEELLYRMKRQELNCRTRSRFPDS